MYANDLGCADCCCDKGLAGTIAAPAPAPMRSISLSTPGATPWGTVAATWGTTVKPVIKPTITVKPISIPMPVLKVPVPTPTPAPVTPPVLKAPTPTTVVTGTTTVIPAPKPVTVTQQLLPSSGGVIVGTLPKEEDTNVNLLSTFGSISPNALMFIGLAALVVFMESGNKKSRWKGR